MAKEVIYVGNGNKHPKFGGTLTFSHSKKQVELLLANLNEKGYVNTLICATKDDPTKFYEKIDTYDGRKQQRNEERVEAGRQSRQPNDNLDDLPF